MRKTAPVVAQWGRDKGKTFILREMPASQSEKWAFRAFLALMNSGVEVPEDVKGLGMAGLAYLGLNMLAGVRYNEIEPLIDEMFTSCVAFVPNPAKPETARGAGTMFPLIEDDIEEVETRLRLRMAIWELHTGFSLADVVPKAAAKRDNGTAPLPA